MENKDLGRPSAPSQAKTLVPSAIYIQFAETGTHCIRKWSREPFVGATPYVLTDAKSERCSCLEVLGEDPRCPMHGLGTEWVKANPDIGDDA